MKKQFIEDVKQLMIKAGVSNAIVIYSSDDETFNNTLIVKDPDSEISERLKRMAEQMDKIVFE